MNSNVNIKAEPLYEEFQAEPYLLQVKQEIQDVSITLIF